MRFFLKSAAPVSFPWWTLKFDQRSFPSRSRIVVVSRQRQLGWRKLPANAPRDEASYLARSGAETSSGGGFVARLLPAHLAPED